METVSVIQQQCIYKQMGNKIGFQADNETVKLAYVEEQQAHINFMKNFKSKYLRSQIKWSSSKIFLFQCTIQQFLAYHTSENVQRLRKQYSKLLSSDNIIVRTNRATINTLEQNKLLHKALSDILMKQFKLEHTQRIQNSVSSMFILGCYCDHQFFKFANCFSITQLHNFNESYVEEKIRIKCLPEKFVLVILRNGIVSYRIQRGKKVERIDGSVIGEKTITSILKFKYPTMSVQQCFDLAFSEGDLKKVDLMVQDIYGKNSHNLGLPGEIIASSLGKFAKMKGNQLSSISQADIIRSLITTFAINTANLIGLYLSKTQMQDAIVLADNFHNDKFYSLLQSISGSYAPGKNICFANHAPFMACLGSAFTNCQSLYTRNN